MAAGDYSSFQKFRLDLVNGVHNLGSDEIRCAFITDTLTAAEGLLTPTLSDFTEVAAGGNYSAGGFAVTCTTVESAGVVTVDLTADIAMAKNASNPANVFQGIIYNNTNVGKEAIGFVEVDLSGADGTSGAINITWGANLFTLAKV